MLSRAARIALPVFVLISAEVFQTDRAVDMRLRSLPAVWLLRVGVAPHAISDAVAAGDPARPVTRIEREPSATMSV
jgi:hypothetical protein